MGGVLENSVTLTCNRIKNKMALLCPHHKYPVKWHFISQYPDNSRYLYCKVCEKSTCIFLRRIKQRPQSISTMKRTLEVDHPLQFQDMCDQYDDILMGKVYSEFTHHDLHSLRLVCKSAHSSIHRFAIKRHLPFFCWFNDLSPLVLEHDTVIPPFSFHFEKRIIAEFTLQHGSCVHHGKESNNIVKNHLFEGHICDDGTNYSINVENFVRLRNLIVGYRLDFFGNCLAVPLVTMCVGIYAIHYRVTHDKRLFITVIFGIKGLPE